MLPGNFHDRVVVGWLAEQIDGEYVVAEFRDRLCDVPRANLDTVTRTYDPVRATPLCACEIPVDSCS